MSDTFGLVIGGLYRDTVNPSRFLVVLEQEKDTWNFVCLEIDNERGLRVGRQIPPIINQHFDLITDFG